MPSHRLTVLCIIIMMLAIATVNAQTTGESATSQQQLEQSYELTVRLRTRDGGAGRHYWVYLRTFDGQVLVRRRTSASGIVRFQKVPALESPYILEVRDNSKIKLKRPYQMPAANDFVLLRID